MPIYEYQCTTNGHRFEKLQAMTAAPIQVCEVCGAPVRKIYHPAGIIFKGSGWYKTDSRASGSSLSDSKSDDKSGATDSKSADKSGATDTKSADTSVATDTKSADTSSATDTKNKAPKTSATETKSDSK